MLAHYIINYKETQMDYPRLAKDGGQRHTPIPLARAVRTGRKPLYYIRLNKKLTTLDYTKVGGARLSPIATTSRNMADLRRCELPYLGTSPGPRGRTHLPATRIP